MVTCKPCMFVRPSVCNLISVTKKNLADFHEIRGGVVEKKTVELAQVSRKWTQFA